MTVLADIHLFWDLSRAAGIAAVILSGLSVTAGLMSGRWTKLGRVGRRLESKTVHEALSLAVIALIGLHGTLLLADPWLRPGLGGIAIPFTLGYRTFWTGLGIIAGYGLALLGLSYYLRRWIGPARWRVAHRFVVVFWLLGLIHTFGAGSDATEPWLWIPVAATSLPALVLLVLRHVPTPNPPPTPRAE
ncbi:MAG: ferric reductase-like transmembrane domain-containing protein [Solirubrobacterales bacterium]|nr:ferric reductase-like transmembrane domain-containing protein [Solirubrobacterales bacterium]